MEEVWFEIQLAVPIEMTADLQHAVKTGIQPKWRVISIDMRRLDKGIFALRLAIPAEDMGSKTPDKSTLIEFRDLVVSLVAFSAMVPVQLRSKGIFDFPIANGKRKQVSLGPMNYEFPPKPLSDLSPLVLGLAVDAKYGGTLHFLWQALNSANALYRFINLAIAIELLVRNDSTLPGSRNPACGDPKCGFQLKVCPECNRAWKIPSGLRERAGFLITDATVLSRFIAQRNEVFHGLSDKLHQSATKNLSDLNKSLLLVIRNYLGTKLGLPSITREDLTIALSPPDLTVTVFYGPKGTASTSALPTQ